MKELLKKNFYAISDIFDNPVARGVAFALWAIPLYFLLDIKISGSDYENIKNFIEWFGVPYGLLLALVVVNVWNQFDAADRTFDQEADAILKVYDTFLLVSSENLRNNSKYLLHVYVRHVKRHYYDEFENRTKINVGDYILGKKIRNDVGLLLDSNEKKNEILATELLKLVNDLIDARGDRLAQTKQRIPKPVLMLSVVTSFIWLIPFFSLDFKSPGLTVFFIGGVVLVVVSILLIIVDLDDPIGGTWEVNLDSWEDLDKIISFP